MGQARRAPPPRSGGFSARRPGNESGSQSLRGLFRDLATALHPDKVADEDEKARRTEVMKEISRAYAERDLARLLELKRIWMRDGGAGSTPVADEIERRCASLERMNVALRVQLKELTRQMKELRRSPHAQVLDDVRRSSGGAGVRRSGKPRDRVAEWIQGAHEERERLRELRDLVVSFREGKITIEQILRGPPSRQRRGPRSGEGERRVEVDADDLLDGLFGFSHGPAAEAPSAPRRRGRGRTSRGARSQDIR